ncbi:MAG: serine/threonine protein phosphatase [Deltaproteobacteria bacterium]|nr:serine/threonine protein phosphatase [Deltaproteobacteria bacterium]
MGRLLAIGDVHGRLSRLERLIAQIGPSADDTLVFLGDYIDRGPDSYEVVELLIDLKKQFPGIITLRGNHEDYIIAVLLGNQNRQERELWRTCNGGEMTLASYRHAGEYMSVHKDFYLNLPVYWETEEYFFCHAGVRRGVPLHEQRPVDLVDNRNHYPLPHENLGKIVVHGHTVVDTPLILSNRINIDTGAGKSGPLTAIELHSRTIWQS